MPSEKLRAILIARSRFAAAEIDAMTEADGWNWVYANAPARTARAHTVCFTGFRDEDRMTLTALAETSGLKVAMSVTPVLSILCVGESPGPAKLAKARALGTPIVDLAQFITLLQTGEIPASPVSASA